MNEEAFNDFAQRATAWLLLFALLAAPAWLWFAWRPIPHAPGVLIPQDPVQVDCPHGALPNVEGYALTRLAEYRIQARVLSARRYSDVYADLVPVDLALGWGAMSDTAVLDQLSISQAGRFYFYEWSGSPPIPQKEIARHSANTHIIPANAEILKFIRHLKCGSLVSLQGSLVEASQGSMHWRSSLTREDTGNGACELMYVTQAEAVPSEK